MLDIRSGAPMPFLSFVLAAVVLTSGEFAWQTGNIHLVAVLAALAAAWVSLTSPAPFRWRLVDAAVFAFLAVMALASLVHLTRFSLNTISIGVIGAAVWFLARQSLTTPLRVTFCLALIVSLIAAEAVVGIDQIYREFPSLQRSFEADPDAARRELGITSDAEWTLLVSRLRTAEPTGTYTLTNTLGGTLAVGVVLVCGFLIKSLTRRHEGTKEFSNSILLRAFVPLCEKKTIAFAGVVLIVLAVCLAATHSRSAMIACGAAAAWGVLVFVKRRAVRIGLVALGLCGMLAILAVSDGARRSLLFRAEYWRATASMIADSPILGCGAGNFQHRYTGYKLPQASEEIADPHNWLLEIAACGGIPAAVIFVGVLILVIAHSGKVGAGFTYPAHATHVAQELRLNVNSSSIAAFVGGVVAVAASYSTEMPITSVVLVPLVLLLPAAVWTCHELAHRKIVASDSLLVAVVIVLLVHLSAAGGVMYTNTQVLLWICGAIIVNRRYSTQEVPQTNRSFDARSLLRAAPWCVAVIVIYLVNFLPVTESQRCLARYVELTQVTRDVAAQHAMLTAARRADPLSTSVATAELEFAERAWAVSQSDESLRAILSAAERLTKLAPESAKLHLRAGESLSAAASVARDKNVRAKLQQHAVWFAEEAAARYPTSASLQASRAMVLSRVGLALRAAEVAETALALDTATPHTDQKLSPPQRAALQEIVPD